MSLSAVYSYSSLLHSNILPTRLKIWVRDRMHSTVHARYVTLCHNVACVTESRPQIYPEDSTMYLSSKNKVPDRTVSWHIRTTAMNTSNIKSLWYIMVISLKLSVPSWVRHCMWETSQRSTCISLHIVEWNLSPSLCYCPISTRPSYAASVH